MRICTITCNNADNYGARLQTYALQRYLESIGHETMIIDYEPVYMQFGVRQWYNPGLNHKEWAKLILRAGQRRLAIRKHRVLERFSDEYLKLTRKYRSGEELWADPPVADVYIAGSDQIWNVSFPNGSDPAFYLDFGDRGVKRLSFAASIALPNLPDANRPFVKERLGGFDSISVREESARRIVKELGYDAAVVCDPVFLLSRDFWKDFADSTGEGDRYLLVYDFESNADLKKVALKLAKSKGLKIYSVSPRPMGYADRNYCDCTPQAFVALLKNADIVVCNSFHGCVYSMIFDRDFYVVNRADGLNCRMYELLARYGCENRIVTPDNVSDERATSPYYTQALENDVACSKAWLTNQLDKK